MASIIKVDTIQDQDGNNIISEAANTITIGASGDTITIPSGATLANSGIVTGFQSTGIDDNATSTAITIDSSQNVGIGTASPNTALQVEKDWVGDYGSINISHSINSLGGLGIRCNGVFKSALIYKGGTSGALLDIGTYNAEPILFRTSNSERMRIDSSGNVGIGTSSPSAITRLQVEHPTNSILDVVTTGGATSRVSTGISSAFFGTVTNHPTILITNGTERMRIDSSGNVGIGTTSPDTSGSRRTLQISNGTNGGAIFLNDNGTGTDNPRLVGGASGTSNLFIAAGGASGIIAFETNNATERMRITSSGFVLAGTTTPINNAHTFKATADSNLYAALSAEDPTTTVGSIRGIVSYASGSSGGAGTGYLYIGRTNTGDQFYVRSDGDCQNTNNSYGAISDRNLKENEVDASSQWNDIKAIQVKNYNLKSLPERTHLGVIAQDLEASGMNGLVKTDDDGTKSVKYSILYMKAVKALQEAMERIETLEAKVQTLENNQL